MSSVQGGRVAVRRVAPADLTLHGHYHCDAQGALPGYECNPHRSYWVADRAVWQIPVAIVIAALGFAAAVVILRLHRD
jgi:hypothetical protein